MISMDIKNQYNPDYVSPPGGTLEEVLNERGMTQAELAMRTGRKVKTINQIIKGKAPITPETALRLERVLSISAGFWNNREKNYREYLARMEEQERLKHGIEWVRKFPYKKMVKFGFVETREEMVQKVQEMLDYFGIASPEQYPEIKERAVAFRKSTAFKSDPDALVAWLRKGEIDARRIRTSPFDKKKFRGVLEEIRSLTSLPPNKFVPEMKELCASCGVVVAFTPQLPKARVCGATRWLTPKKALIQLSLRYKTNDFFWFAFFHEAGHILLHGKRERFIDEIDYQGEKEDEADRFASNFLIPSKEYSSLLARREYKSKMGVIKLARKIGVAPGIVVGRLQHDKYIPRNHMNGLKEKYEWNL
ncbi:MAG: helix-turn-helix domain-containing protein [Candidatus Eremiobacteraeota bacterium]|nr:helix-turn-helix domain-containing protein [Candidatus Eremiobacteraeota bacterium]